MKGKFARKLSSLMLAAIMTVTFADIPVYASGEAAGTQSAIDVAETQTASSAENTETLQTEPTETESSSTETSQAEPTETESSSTETPQTEPTETELPSTETSQAEPTETESSSTETPQTESTETESSETETSQTESTETESPSTETSPEESEYETEEIQETEETQTTSPKDGWLDLYAFVINPFYAEMYDGEYLEVSEELQLDSASDGEIYEANGLATVDEAAAYIREKMLLREGTIAFSIPASLVPSSDTAFSQFAQGLVDAATAYTDACTGQQGDALAWGYRTYSVRTSGSTSADQRTITFDFTYTSTAEQESQLTEKVKQVMGTLNLSAKSDYEKVRAIHDYICDNVDYDYELKKYSAYDALCTGKAVCQGYAVLFYRMCKEVGLSVRIISGKGNGGAHGWNIVRIGGVASASISSDEVEAEGAETASNAAAGSYYNVDCTWDGQGSNTHHAYFLKCNADFVNHERDAKYNTAAFNTAFPMSDKSYKLSNGMNVDNLKSKSMWIYDGAGNDKTASMTASGRPKVLIFIQTTCTRSQGTVQSVARERFADSADIYVISADSYGSDAYASLGSFIRSYASGNTEITFGVQIGNIWTEYCDLAVDNNVKTPTIVYIDSSDKVQHITFGQETANAIRDNITAYCSGSGAGKTAYIVTYVLDGGTNHTGNPSAYVKNTEEIVLLAPTREGYVFKGWYTDRELTNSKSKITNQDSGNLTLYAKWEEEIGEPVNYIVKFDVQGHGTAPAAYTGGAGFFVAEPPVPSAAGYIFGGWYRDRECTKAWNFKKDTLQSDMVLYAKWMKELTGGFGVQEIADVTYTGKPCKPTVSVYDGSMRLKENTDYSVTYSNNVDAGDKAVVNITGKGNYLGTALKTGFKIVPAALADKDGNPSEGLTVRYTEQSVTNTKETITPLKSVRLGRTLKAGTDYTVSVETVNAKDAGGNTATGKFSDGVIPKGYSGSFKLKIEGKGNYEGIVEMPVYVLKSSELVKNTRIAIGSKVLDVKLEDYVKAGKVELVPADKEGEKYFKYVTGNSNNSATVETTKQDVEQSCFTVKSGQKYLKCGTDFTVTYSDNDKVGKASMTIVGMGSFAGSKTVTFNIKGKTLSTKTVTISGLVSKMDYTGNPRRQNFNVVTLYYGSAKMECGKDYTVSYKNNIDKGTAVMTFTAMEGSVYSGSFTKTFQIKAADIKTAKRDGGMNNITVPYCKSGVDISEKIKLTNDAGQLLIMGKDYTVSYKRKPAPNDVGSALTATIKGKGNYDSRSKLEVKFTVTKGEPDSGMVTIAPTAYDSKKASEYKYKPKVTVKDGNSTLSPDKDYTVVYEKNTQKDYETYRDSVKNGANPDTDTGRPKAIITFKNSALYGVKPIEVTLPIYEIKLSESNLYVVMDKAVYTGSQIKPAIKVYYGKKAAVDAAKKKEKENGKPLGEADLKDLTLLNADREYTVSYGANVNAGKNKGSVTIRGKEPFYGGGVTVKFTIGVKKVTENKGK